MGNVKGFTAAVLIASIIASGCQTSSNRPLIEYAPQSQPLLQKAPESGVFVLWRDQKIAQATTAAATMPVVTKHREKRSLFQVEVEQAYVERGSPIGFRIDNQSLIGVAGPTTMALQSARYSWRKLNDGIRDDDDIRTRNVIDTVIIVFVVAAVIGTVFGVLHVNRHHDVLGPFLESIFNS